MKEQRQTAPPPGILEGDWEQTPLSVRMYVLAMYEQVQGLMRRVQELEEQVRRNSRNSSQPPSSDGPGQKASVERKPKGGKPGGRKGHQGHRRELLPIEQVDEVIKHKPEVCSGCGTKLAGEDPTPYRYQVTELPPIAPHITEHQVHCLDCPCCGRANRGELPAEVANSQFGPNLVSLMAILMGVYRLSKRQVSRILDDCFNIKLSASSVVKQQGAVSAALEEAVEEAKECAQRQDARNIDETGWPQIEEGQRGWLWVVVTPLVTVFRVALSRAGQVAKELLGEDRNGIVGSDRYSAYNWIPVELRQVCWSHLRRDFQKILERGGPSARVGEPLCLLAESVLHLWARVRDGTLPLSAFLIRLPAFQNTVHHWLTEGAGCSHPKTAKTCRLILKLEPALWTFATHPKVEPTNNSAERALRSAVIWRGISHGTQNEAGSRFVERILTVTETCRQQGRNPLHYVRQAVIAHRSGLPFPSLLPVE
jgi:transposase